MASDNKVQNQVEKRLHFERLLTDITTSFVNLPIKQIDTQIKQAQQRICSFLNLDRSVIWQIIEGESGKVLLSHIHNPFEGFLPDTPFVPEEMFPWVWGQILQSKNICINDVEDLPPEAERDRKSIKQWGVKSCHIAPMSAGGHVSGAVSFCNLHDKMIWSAKIVQQLQLVTLLFASAISRRQVENQAKLHRQFELLVTDISARFVNLPVELIDGTIEEAQREICECLGVDLSALWQWTAENPRILTLSHLHSPPPPLGPERPDGIDAEEAFPWISSKVLKSKTLVISTENMLPEASLDQATRRGFNVKSSVVIPLSTGGGPVIGVLTFDDLQEDRVWPDETVERLTLIAQVFTNALDRRRSDLQQRAHLQEIRDLKDQLEKDNINLRKEIELQHGHEDIVGRSPVMQDILAQVEQVAQTDATVLIEGETGTGKELLARAVHRLSMRKDRPLVTVNCASLPPTLVESELFGREKGAYTGALTRMTGRFEMADGATLFLDEIGELPLEVQAKLLRVLEQGSFERLGSAKSMQVDVRIIAATNQDLSRQMAAGRFRKDLYYRLNVFPIHLPPLKEHREDIPPLVWTFVRQYEKTMGRRIDHIKRSSMDELMRYAWPGNVRELRNLIERALIVCNNRTLDLHPPQGAHVEMTGNQTLREAERRHILSVMQQTGWRLSGAGGAADILGLKRTTLQSKMKKLDIVRPKNA